MNAKLIERLAALDEAADAIRTKLRSKAASKLDALVLAELLLFVDKSATRLAALERALQATLFDGDKESA